MAAHDTLHIYDCTKLYNLAFLRMHMSRWAVFPVCLALNWIHYGISEHLPKLHFMYYILKIKLFIVKEIKAIYCMFYRMFYKFSVMDGGAPTEWGAF